MINVLGLPLEAVLSLPGMENMRVEELKGRLPRKNDTNEDNTAPRENSARGTLRIVRQKGNVLSVCRFNDTILEESDETDRSVQQGTDGDA